MKVRVLAYNILGGRASVALRSVVRTVEPDVMVVNESPQIPLVWRWRCPTLARQWELQHIAGGRNAGRNMICAQYHVGVSHTDVQRFSQPRFRPIRGVVSAQLQIDSHPFGLVGCHLSLDATRRLHEVDRVLNAAAGLDGPVILAGDLNEPPSGACWERLRAAGFVDGGERGERTFPSSGAVERIDALLVRGNVHISEHGVPPLQDALLRMASDHLPLVATFSWP